MGFYSSRLFYASNFMLKLWFFSKNFFYITETLWGVQKKKVYLLLVYNIPHFRKN